VRKGREGAMAGRREEWKRGVSISWERRGSRAAPRGRSKEPPCLGGSEGLLPLCWCERSVMGKERGLLLVVCRRREWMDKVNGGENNYKG